MMARGIELGIVTIKKRKKKKKVGAACTLVAAGLISVTCVYLSIVTRL